jgi:serine/threonine protein kinase/Tfp pilus assembly protein PilF
MSKSQWTDERYAGCDDRDCDPDLDSDELDEYVREFEHAYNIEGEADLADHLPPPGHPLRLRVLRELVRVDLEYGWEQGAPKSLEHYQRAFPELKNDREGLREIAFEEYRLRGLAGEAPSVREYYDRFGVTVDAQSNRVFSVGSSRFSASPTFSKLLNRDDPHGGLGMEISGLPKVGDQFLGFRLVEVIGRGSFGRVYLARQGDLADRPIVLKVTADRHDESQTLAQLRHDNIVPVYSSHASGSLRAVCMPYLGSVTLRDVFEDLKSRETLPGSGRELVSSLAKSSVRKRAGSSVASVLTDSASATATEPAEGKRRTEIVPRHSSEANEKGVETLGVLGALSYVGAVVWMASRLADGLAHAHDRGILHRDMKPANILLTDDGKPMLLDFNLAEDLKRRATDPGVEEAAIGGTLAYMAPEHLEAYRGGARSVDARSDLFSFGVILYEMLTGRPPFPPRAGRRTEILAAMIGDRLEAPPSLRRWNPAVSPAVESVVRRCLEPDPSNRYESARALAEDLSRHLAHLPLKHAADPSTTERASKLAKRHPKLTVLALALLASGAIGLIASVGEKTKQSRIASAFAAFDRFQDRSRAAESLLNAWHRNPLKRTQGIEAARAALADLHADGDPSWWTRAPTLLLPQVHRNRLRQATGELLLALARAETQAATASTDPKSRDRLLRSALAASEQAERSFPGGRVPRAVLHQRAEILLGLGDESGAGALLARAQATPLDSARDNVMMGAELFHHGRHAEALAYYEKAVRQDSQDYDGLFGAAVCHDWLRNPSQAEPLYNICVSLRPEDPSPLYNRGSLRLQKGDLDQGKNDLQHAARLMPDDPDPVANLAVLAHRQRRFREAIAGFDRALALGSNATRWYFARADCKRALGDLAGASADVREGLQRRPNDVASWVARGRERVNQGDLEGGMSDFNEALAIDPDSYAALTNKAYVYAEKQGKTEDAIAALDQVLARNNRHPFMLASRGILRARLGQDDAAKADARHALEIDPNAEIFYKVACIYALTSRQTRSDRDEAIKHLVVSRKRGYGANLIVDDRDLDPIRDDREFQRLVDEAKRAVPSSSR